MDKITLPLVTIVIPCRNEEKHIAKCLDAVLAQDYPGGRLEIIVVDGASTDGTRRIGKLRKKRPPDWMLDNKKISLYLLLTSAYKVPRGKLSL